jgi:hypothetical protein
VTVSGVISSDDLLFIPDYERWHNVNITVVIRNVFTTVVTAYDLLFIPDYEGGTM